jgi:dTMP kinase
MKNILRNFVVFEGCDGSGTTTQLARLENYFSEREGLPSLWTTSEPTSGEIGRLIRSFLRGETRCRPETLARLFAADRCEHLFGDGGIVSRCERGELVVSDRYTLSSLVYQGLECGDSLPRRLNDDFPVPELLLFFDISSDTAEERMAQRLGRDIFEYIEFQKKARQKYLSLLDDCRRDGSIVAVINAESAVEDVFREILSFISKLPIIT